MTESLHALSKDEEESESLLSILTDREPKTTPMPPANESQIRGTVYFLIFGALSCANLFLAKGAYERNPDLTTWQLLFVRSIGTAIILTLYVNVGAKKVMYDDVDRESLPSLAFRSI